MRGLFIAGTDTDVGKTITASCIVHALDADYWKPIQSGMLNGSDTTMVSLLANVKAAHCHSPVYTFDAPLSPHAAALLDGKTIDLDIISLPKSERPLIVEGAGGVLVPLNEKHLIIDLIKKLKLSVVVVCRSGLGTINHTLMSLEALRHRDIPIAGVVMNGLRNHSNEQAIRFYGNIQTLIPLLPLTPLNYASVAKISSRFRKFMNV